MTSNYKLHYSSYINHVSIKKLLYKLKNKRTNEASQKNKLQNNIERIKTIREKIFFGTLEFHAARTTIFSRIIQMTSQHKVRGNNLFFLERYPPEYW